MKYIKIIGTVLLVLIIILGVYSYVQSKKGETIRIDESQMGGNTGICGSGGEFC
jgi:hypothetical protein